MVGVFCNLRAESCAARKPKLANLEKMSTIRWFFGSAEQCARRSARARTQGSPPIL